MSEVGVLAAFAAGVLALLSPCSALLLPSFFAYAFASRRALVARTLVFYLGLLVTLVPLGTGASAASSLFYGHRPLLIAIAGWTIIGLGVLQLLGRGFALPGSQRLQGFVASRGDSGWLSTLLLGAVYGLAGFCSGPVLGAILTVAATQEAPWQGGALLAVYALGMAAPLLVLAAVWDRFDLGNRRWLRGRAVSLGPVRVHTTSVVAGLLFIAVGVVFLRYDGTAGLTGSLGFGNMTDLEYDAQQAVTEWAAGIPAWALPLAVVLVASAVAWRRRGEHVGHGVAGRPACQVRRRRFGGRGRLGGGACVATCRHGDQGQGHDREHDGAGSENAPAESQPHCGGDAQGVTRDLLTTGEHPRTCGVRGRRRRTLARTSGEVLLTLGVVSLLFVAYELWGTGLETARAQNRLADDLRHAWSQPLPATPSAAMPEGFARLHVPSLPGVEPWIVVEGVGVEDLKQGPGHMPGTALPGQLGNVVLSGHRTTYGAPFNRWDEFRAGDQVVLETREGWFTYTMTGAQVVEPDAVQVALPVPGQPGAVPTASLLTMTTCEPEYSAEQRLVLRAELTARTPRSAGPPAVLAAVS